MQRDWVSVWVLLIGGFWLFSAWCWLAPSVPGVWNQGCVPITPGRYTALCENVPFVSNFPHTQMPENKQICETAGEGAVRKCRYVGVKIGEALRYVEDRDLLTMMMVFGMNTLVFIFSVSLRSSGHRCQRTKADAEEEIAEFDMEHFDLNESLVPRSVAPAAPETLTGKVASGLRGMRESRREAQEQDADGDYSSADLFESENHRGSMLSPSRNSISPTAASARKSASAAVEDDTDLDLEKISLEMLGLVNIVRQPDEVVYVHCGADAYLYMRYQKYMINMLWIMFLFSCFVLLPNQYGKRESHGTEKEFMNTFYLWANAANLPGQDEGGGRMYAQLYAVFFFSFLVMVWLTEFRKLMVKLTDPTYVAELNSQVQDVERWGSEDDSAKAAMEDAVSQEARARTLEVQNVPIQLSRHEILRTIEQAVPDQLLEVHVPARVGRSLLSRTGLDFFQPDGAGSGMAYLTFKQRAHARAFRDTFKKMQAKTKKKQSLQVDLGAVGTFGVDVGMELPQFMQETIDRVTDVDAHYELVMNQVETNVMRAEDATDSVTQTVKNLLFFWRTPESPEAAVEGDGSPRPRSPRPDSPNHPNGGGGGPEAMGGGRMASFGRRGAISADTLRQSQSGRKGNTSPEGGVSPESPDSLARMASSLFEGSDGAALMLSFPETFNSNKWKVNWAPEAGDIVWNNLHISGKERKLRKAFWSLIILIAFFTIAYLYNKYAMEKTMVYLLTEATKTTTGIEEGAMFDNTLNGKSYQFGKLIYGLVTIYAPVVVLCLVNYGILPVVCMVSSLLEGRKKTSSIQKAVLRKNYTLMIINILILPTLALKTPDAFLAQFKHLSDSIQMQKTYDWTIGYCHNGCQCYGATSFHVCDDQSFSPWEKTATDENMLPTFHECQRRPCEPGDVPGDARKSEGVGPGGEAARIPHGGSMAHPTWGCYNLTGDANDIQPSWDAAHDSPIINGCSRNSSNDFGEPGGPDYHHLWPVCQESKIYCHHVTVHCQGQCETNDYLKIIGNFVLAANASFLYCFVVSAALLGTGWQLLNAAFYVFCLLQVACSKKGNAESEIEFWDLATNTDKISTTMKEKGYAFEIGYYYAVGLVIFAIVIFYSVHFPPVCFAGLLYFNCKHFVDKYNLLYVYPVNCSDHVRSGGQMGGTVHDMVLFSLCLMQLGMAAFFKVKDPDSVRWTLYLFAVTLAWFFVSVRRSSPANSEIVFGDENIEILDVPGSSASPTAGDLSRETSTAQTAGGGNGKIMVTSRQVAQAYAQPLDRAALNLFQ